jgi:hypothetical protein
VEPAKVLQEVRKCRKSPAYFLDTYCQVYDATALGWVPFKLWAAQERALATTHGRQLTIMLKARQLGFSWLALGYALWLMLFRPAATVLIFSKRDDEAVELLDFRLKEMSVKLPPWLRPADSKTDGKHAWLLANGSRALAFPTTGGRSYTGTFVIVDEADFMPNLNKLLNAVKPTVDAGGKMVLLSTVDKGRPQSTFKLLYAAAKKGENAYAPIFCGWRERPGRTDAWYAEQKRDALSRTGSLDDLHQEYPETDAEALSPRTLDKRIAPEWLRQCYREGRPLVPLPQWELPPPSIPGLALYRVPRRGAGEVFVIGADPAEGNPTSDDSAFEVIDADTGEQVACLAGRLQPAVFAAHIDAVGRYYNNARALVERNNHGHAVILWLRDHGKVQLLAGHDNAVGWLSNSKGKALLYGEAADAFRERNTLLHDFATFLQLCSVEGATLRAPEGEMDDRAVAYALALVAAGQMRRLKAASGGRPYVYQGGGVP